MKFLAISGSTRAQSTNTALLRALAELTPPPDIIHVYDGLAGLPMFSPDMEGDNTPPPVRAFCHLVDKADGLIISSPEYVRAIPGGLKNVIDWLSSREEIADKPIAILHASHRGDNMLASLGLVLKTMSAGFNENIFERFALTNKTPDEIHALMQAPENTANLNNFIDAFHQYILSRSS